MPEVKRFRSLGSLRQVDREGSHEKLVEDQSSSKVVRRFESQSGSRKVRRDKKHHFPLRVDYTIWDKVEQVSLDCGSLRVGASLNVICCKLLSYALSDELIVKQILSEFPENDRFVFVRSWRDD